MSHFKEVLELPFEAIEKAYRMPIQVWIVLALFSGIIIAGLRYLMYTVTFREAQEIVASLLLLLSLVVIAVRMGDNVISRRKRINLIKHLGPSEKRILTRRFLQLNTRCTYNGDPMFLELERIGIVVRNRIEDRNTSMVCIELWTWNAIRKNPSLIAVPDDDCRKRRPEAGTSGR